MAADPSIDAAEAVALFRYKLIAEAANPRLGPAERGQLVRELASQPVELPDGGLHHFSRGTFDRWLRAYREHGPGPSPSGAVGGGLPVASGVTGALRRTDQRHPARTPWHPCR